MKIKMRLVLLLILTVMFNKSSDATEELKFEYQIQRFNQSSQIAFQVYKNAPYPAPYFQEEFNWDFKRVVEDVVIDGQTVSVSYYSGWVFMDIDSKHDSCVLPLVTTLEKFRQGQEVSDSAIPSLAKILRCQCEQQNLSNPYAGKSLSADYKTSNGIPVEDILIPTTTPIKNGDQFVKSLAFVYGGKLELNDARTIGFYHGDYRIFSYGNRTISAYSSGSQPLKAKFRYTDDGVTANTKMEIISFPAWF